MVCRLTLTTSNHQQGSPMKFVQVALALAAVAALAGCSSAPKSNEVAAAYVPTAQYQAMTCDQLVAEAEGIRRALPALSSSVDEHRKNQDGVELVTWILFWPAAFALDKGEGKSAQLARAKGEYDAISLALRTKNCDKPQMTAGVASGPTGGASAVNTVATATPEMGRDTYVVEQAAKASACHTSPQPKMVAKGPGFETYSVQCASSDVVMYRCELGNCRVLN